MQDGDKQLDAQHEEVGNVKGMGDALDSEVFIATQYQHTTEKRHNEESNNVLDSITHGCMDSSRNIYDILNEIFINKVQYHQHLNRNHAQQGVF